MQFVRFTTLFLPTIDANGPTMVDISASITDLQPKKAMLLPTLLIVPMMLGPVLLLLLLLLLLLVLLLTLVALVVQGMASVM